MNRIILFTIALSGFFVQTMFAQKSLLRDSTEAYNYWAKRDIIETTYAYMQDFIETVGEGEAVVGSNLEANNSENKRPQSGVGFHKKTKQILWETLLIYASIFIIGVLIGILFIFTITKSKIKSIVNEECKSKYNDYLRAANDTPYLLGYLRVVYFLNKQKEKYKKNKESANQNNDIRVAELEKEVSHLEIDKKNLLEENIRLGEKIEQQKESEKEKTTYNKETLKTNQQASNKITKLYFSIPEENGSFKLSNSDTTNDKRKYFRIEHEESSTKGELFYLPSDRDKRAINRLESYLKPVCEIENIANSTTTNKIEVIKSGKVNLINDSWVIDPENKIKIKLY